MCINHDIQRLTVETEDASAERGYLETLRRIIRILTTRFETIEAKLAIKSERKNGILLHFALSAT